MDNNALINIHMLLINIRFKITDTFNVKIIENIIRCLNCTLNNVEFVKLITEVDSKLLQQLVMEDGDKIKIFNSYKVFMVDMLEITIDELYKNNYDLAYDIIDMLHVLPEIMLSEDRRAIRRYYKFYVKPIVKKWNFCKISHLKRYFY